MLTALQFVLESQTIVTAVVLLAFVFGIIKMVISS